MDPARERQSPWDGARKIVGIARASTCGGRLPNREALADLQVALGERGECLELCREHADERVGSKVKSVEGGEPSELGGQCASQAVSVERQPADCAVGVASGLLLRV